MVVDLRFVVDRLLGKTSAVAKLRELIDDETIGDSINWELIIANRRFCDPGWDAIPILGPQLHVRETQIHHCKSRAGGVKSIYSLLDGTIFTRMDGEG